MSYSGFKQSITNEAKAFLAVFTFLAPLFFAFSTYRMMVLHEFSTKYFAYGAALVNAFVLSKVILIGEYARLGKRAEKKPLIFSTLFKAFLFTLFAAMFQGLEDTIRAIVHGNDLATALHEAIAENRDDLFGRSIVMFCAFIPFFAIREVGRVMGEGKLFDLFFRRRPASELHVPG